MNYSTSEQHMNKVLRAKAKEVQKRIIEDGEVMATCAAKIRLAIVLTTPVTGLVNPSSEELSNEETKKIIAKMNEKLGEVNKLLLELEANLNSSDIFIPNKAIDIASILLQTKDKHAVIEYE